MADRNSKAKSAAKRAAKSNPKAFIIALIAVILIVAIGFCVLYFGFPDTWDSIMSAVRGDDKPDGAGGTPPSGDLTLGEGELKVHFVNVGQGDCIYIQFPDNTDMIIDCGNKSRGYDFQTVKSYLTALNPDGKINHLMLTHADEDHVDNMDEIIYEFEIENIYMPNILSVPKNSKGEPYADLQEQIDNLDRDTVARFDDKDVVNSRTYANFFIAALSEENCEVHINEDPDEQTNSIVIQQETFRLTFYCPTEEYYDATNLNNAERKNAVSPIGILEYNNRRVVLTGDSNEINEPIFVRRIGGKLDCDVLKVGHHGSATSSTAEFLDAITCEYAVISCNKEGNTFVHPRQVTLDRFKARNMSVYRTDKHGSIVLTIDGEGELKFTVDNSDVTDEEIFKGADTENAEATLSALSFTLPLFAQRYI